MLLPRHVLRAEAFERTKTCQPERCTTLTADKMKAYGVARHAADAHTAVAYTRYATTFFRLRRQEKMPCHRRHYHTLFEDISPSVVIVAAFTFHTILLYHAI